MGDRCWLQVTVRKRDEQKFLEAVDEDPRYLEREEDEWGNPRLTCDEANYGWYDELDVAAAAGCVFHGDHGAGGEYGPATFASDGSGGCHNVDADRESMPVVVVGEQGPDKNHLQLIADYWQTYRGAERLMENTGATALREVVDDRRDGPAQGAGGDEEVGE
jgi:hypothetical protein